MDYIIWDAGVLWDQVQLLGSNVGNIFNVCIIAFLAISGVYFIATLVRSIF